MRICLLTQQDVTVDPFPDDDWPCDPRPFLPEAEWHVRLVEKTTAARTVKAVVKEGFDLYFNLCDSAPEQETPGIEVARALERLYVPYTGASPESYEPTRLQMKRACRALGIATPAWVFAKCDADIERAAEKLRFPLFVKHHLSYASISLSRASRVRTPAGLMRQARKIIRRHGKALIEEFIDGAEATVLVAENPDDPQRPTTYQPIRYVFPAGETFKHSKLKWEDFDGVSAVPVEDPVLDAKLRDMSARFFVALKGVSFGRCDIRIDAAGTPFMLEINSNCGIYYPPSAPGSADLCLALDPAGHEGFTRQIVRAAFARHRRRLRESENHAHWG